MKSWIEISGARLAENFHAVQAVVGPGAETLAVIKADAYGHGADLCAPVLVNAGARWLGVADVEEGAAVRSSLGTRDARLLLMCGLDSGDAAEIVGHGLTAVVWTSEHIAALEQAATAAGKQVAVHLEIDTGMGRQGAAGPGMHVRSPELASVLERLRTSTAVRCEGLMTHFCSSEVAGSRHTLEQRERFEAVVGEVLAAGLRPEYLHVANTSAVDEGSTLGWLPKLAERAGAKPMVRAGLAIYGYALPIEAAEDRSGGALRPRLRPVLAWKARVAGIRELEPGATVGYSATYQATEPMRVALLPIGYADGFRRAASSGMGDGWVLIDGQRAPVLGRVSMNLTVVDVTGIPGVDVETEVVLLGDGVTAADHGRWSGTIPYEILCGIRGRRRLV